MEVCNQLKIRLSDRITALEEEIEILGKKNVLTIIRQTEIRELVKVLKLIEDLEDINSRTDRLSLSKRTRLNLC